MKIETFHEPDGVADRAAEIVSAIVHGVPQPVLGLPTGRTPREMYARLVSLAGEGLSFDSVRTFNLDEYVGIGPEHPGSFHRYMCTHFYEPAGVPAERRHIPRGDAADVHTECERYERLLAQYGPCDLMILGLGGNGHIGFNEPGAAFDGRTHVARLAEATRRANASAFEPDPVPTHAITMGIATILESKRILVLVVGEHKAEALAQAVNGPVVPDVPASILQRHPDVTILADRKAAAGLPSSR